MQVLKSGCDSIRYDKCKHINICQWHHSQRKVICCEDLCCLQIIDRWIIGWLDEGLTVKKPRCKAASRSLSDK